MSVTTLAAAHSVGPVYSGILSPFEISVPPAVSAVASVTFWCLRSNGHMYVFSTVAVV